MNKRKLTKDDLGMVKERARDFAREYGSDQVKASLADFKRGVPIGFFDDEGRLVAWRVMDPETKKPMSGVGDIKVRAANPEPAAPSMPKASSQNYEVEPLVGQPPQNPYGMPEPGPDFGVPPLEALHQDDFFQDDFVQDDLAQTSPVQFASPQQAYPLEETQQLPSQPTSAQKPVKAVAPTKGQKKKGGAASTIIAIVIVVLVLGGVAAGVYFGGSHLINHFFPQQQVEDDAPDYDAYVQIGDHDITHVVITSGATIKDIRLKLCEAGLPNQARDFIKRASEKGADEKVQAGDYIIIGNEDVDSIIDRMVICDRIPDGVIGVNEGDTLEMIKSAVSSSNVKFDMGDFDREIHTPAAFAAEFPMLSGIRPDLPSLEGYFMTGEYNIGWCENAHDAVKVMLGPMEARFEQANLPSGVWLDVLTKASMIEKEALFDEDRPLIASVIENRLRENMQLQIDATIQYAKGSSEGRVSYADLEIDSPYNTYKNFGLPIGPICSGISAPSIDAVLNVPQTDFLYYVLKDVEGHHAFSSTPEQFAIDKQHYNELFGVEEGW